MVKASIMTVFGQDEVFLANYADGLSDLDLKGYVDAFVEGGKVACFLSVPTPSG